MDYFTFSRPYPRWLDPRRFSRDRRLEPVPAYPLLDYLSPRSWRASADAVASRRPDALIVPWWTSFWGAPFRTVFRRLAAEAPRVLRLLLCHNLEDHERGPVRSFLTLGTFSVASAFLAHSEEDRAELARRFPGRPVAVLPLPTLADLPRDRDAARRRLAVDGEAPLVLFLGLVRRYKGVDLLLDAAPRIVRETGARIAVVGEVFPDARELGARRKASPVRESVLWKDEYVSEEEMGLWLAACDVLVLPYREISSSAIAARGLAARRPIAASAVGGLKEAVRPGITGELFAPGDAEGLAEAVARVLARGAESYTPGLEEAARRAAWPNYARRILRFLESIAPAGRPS